MKVMTQRLEPLGPVHVAGGDEQRSYDFKEGVEALLAKRGVTAVEVELEGSRYRYWSALDDELDRAIAVLNQNPNEVSRRWRGDKLVFVRNSR